MFDEGMGCKLWMEMHSCHYRTGRQGSAGILVPFISIMYIIIISSIIYIIIISSIIYIIIISSI